MSSDQNVEHDRLVEGIAARLRNPSKWLVENLYQHKEAGRTGVEIATDWDARKHSETPMSESRCRRLVTDVRDSVDSYYRTDEGLDERLRLWIPKNKSVKGPDYNPYHVDFALNNGAASFWKTHLKKRRENALIVTEPVFFRDTQKRHLYLRHFEVNRGGAEGVKAIKEKVPGLQQLPLEDIRHYVSFAEMKGMLATVGFLEGFRIVSDRPVAQHMRVGDERIEDRNVIAFGTSRANVEIDTIQRNNQLGYSIEEDHLLIRNPTDLERSLLEASETPITETGIGVQIFEDQCERIVYAVVTRGVRPNGRSETAIASNHGAATQGICELLANDESVKKLTTEMHLDEDWHGFPLAFQILFRVELDSDESRPKQVTYVSWRRGKDGGPI